MAEVNAKQMFLLKQIPNKMKIMNSKFVKQKNADLENKITLDRAIEIFSTTASKLVTPQKIEFLFKDQELK